MGEEVALDLSRREALCLSRIVEALGPDPDSVPSDVVATARQIVDHLKLNATALAASVARIDPHEFGEDDGSEATIRVLHETLREVAALQRAGTPGFDLFGRTAEQAQQSRAAAVYAAAAAATGSNPEPKRHWVVRLGSGIAASIAGLVAIVLVGCLLLGGIFVLAEVGSWLTSDSEASSGEDSPYLDACRDYNRENRDQYTDPEQCAQDAEKMNEDLVDYLSQ